jgi:uncharacterized protein YjeT (DUF2065 family)
MIEVLFSCFPRLSVFIILSISISLSNATLRIFVSVLLILGSLIALWFRKQMIDNVEIFSGQRNSVSMVV